MLFNFNLNHFLLTRNQVPLEGDGSGLFFQLIAEVITMVQLLMTWCVLHLSLELFLHKPIRQSFFSFSFINTAMDAWWVEYVSEINVVFWTTTYNYKRYICSIKEILEDENDITTSKRLDQHNRMRTKFVLLDNLASTLLNSCQVRFG